MDGTYLDAVPQAVHNALLMFKANDQGFFLVHMKYKMGRSRSPCIARPPMTTAKYLPRFFSVVSTFLTDTHLEAIKKTIPTGAYLKGSCIRNIFIELIINNIITPTSGGEGKGAVRLGTQWPIDDTPASGLTIHSRPRSCPHFCVGNLQQQAWPG